MQLIRHHIQYGLLALAFLLCCCQGDANSSSRQGKSKESRSDDAGVEPSEDAYQAIASEDFDASDLARLSTGELLLLEQERRNQDYAEQEELELLDILNQELCKRLDQLRQKCPATKRLIPDANERLLQCELSSDEDKSVDVTYEENGMIPQKIEVSIPKDKQGSFVLVANDNFQSTPFGAGTSEIEFKSTGSVNFLAPQFIQVYKLVLRSAGSKRQVLPELRGFNLTLKVDGLELLSEPLHPSEDTALREQKKEYKVSVQDIIDIRKSSTCLVTDREVQELKATLRSAVKQQQAQARKARYIKDLRNENLSGRDSERNGVIEKIFTLRTKISQRLPILEGERDRQYKLSNELKTDVSLGCHAHEPIELFELEVDGSLLSSVYLRNQKNKQPPNQGDGKSTELAFDFGTVKFTVDLGKNNILGSRYVLSRDISDESLIGGLDRLVVRKKGVEYDNLRECKSVIPILGQWEKCEHAVYEMNVMTIDAIRVFANGKKIYAAKDLRIRLDHQSTQAAVESFRMNENWIKLMQETDCNKTR